mgnify:CR=1 FL=1
MTKDKLEKELELRTTAQGLIRYARDYFKAYKIVQQQEPKIISLYQVKFYLLCHAIELALKADLKRRGYTRKQLLDLGHNLENLLRLLKEKHEVILDAESMKQILLADSLYSSKQFEYPQTGEKYLADFMKLELITGLILNKVTLWIEK